MLTRVTAGSFTPSVLPGIARRTGRLEADASIIAAIDRGMGLGPYTRAGLDHVDQLRGGTMLNAGNELRAEDAGCTLLARVSDACFPYLGTVLAIVDRGNLDAASRLARALVAAGADVLDGWVRKVAEEEAMSVLGLSGKLARRYVERLRDPAEGLVAGGAVETEALAKVVNLRRRYLPGVVDGRDTLLQALDPDSGLRLRPVGQT